QEGLRAALARWRRVSNLPGSNGKLATRRHLVPLRQTAPPARFLIGGLKIDRNEQVAGQPQWQQWQRHAHGARSWPKIDFRPLLTQDRATSHGIKLHVGRQFQVGRGVEQPHGLVMEVGTAAGNYVNDDETDALVQVAGTLDGKSAAFLGAILVAGTDQLN